MRQLLLAFSGSLGDGATRTYSSISGVNAYDAAGNQKNDGYTSFGSSNGTVTRTYDAENRLITASDVTNNTTDTYTYDGGLTGLDFFEARYYASTQGRFTSVDPLMASGRLPSPQTWNRYTYSLNNPLRFTDPSGMVPGDYYNEEGKRLGTDGINNKKVYVVTNDAPAKQIQKTDKQGGTTQVSAVSSAVELPGYDVRQAIGAAVDRSNAPSGLDKDGGSHEEGLQWGKNASGQEQIVDAAPGAYSDVKTAARATVVTGTAANPAEQGAITTLEGTAHVHPKAEVVTGPGPGVVFGGTTTTRNWIQPPSPVDISNAGNRPGTTNIVVGARDKKVYVYDGTGTKATFPLK